MSISFSGLASGLDTTSWVESLVKLRQAKVTSLEEEKESVLLSKETLNGIKAFFTSFRSTIEKITAAKSPIYVGSSSDVFAQNLATSSNVNIVSGIATYEAQEATYDILVDKLATETKASSNYNYMTTIVETTTATGDSKLIHLGVKAGNIGVMVNDIQRGLSITENDTIATFIEKLRDIGVESSYNEQTGIFSANLSAGAIKDDIDHTGIVEALHLTGVNEGYTSNSLQTSSTETVFYAATEGTTLKELGVSAGVVTIEANNATYNITITNTTTLKNFIDSLNAKNIEASLDSEGIFTISDAEIVSQGTTNIINALGLASSIYDKTQTTGNLTNRTIITQVTTATSSTLLKDLGDGISISNNSTVIVKNSNNKTTTITVGTTTTVGSLLNAMTSAGLSASINSEGIVEISGGTITGGSFDAVTALGLDSSPYTAMVTGNPLTETIVTQENASLSTRLVEDLGVKKGYLEVTDANNTKMYLKIYSGQTFANLKSSLESYGLSCSLDEANGVLNITGGSFKTLTDSEVVSLVNAGKISETNATYKKGTDLLEHLFGAGTISTDHITVESAYAKSQALKHTVTSTVSATLTTTLNKLGLSSNGTAIFDVNGVKSTINVTTTMTIQGLIDAIGAKGISASWDNEASKLTIENATISGGTSNLSSVLNLSETIYGKYTTSNVLYSKTTNLVEATRATTLNNFGITSSQTAAQRTVNLYNSAGTIVGTMTVTQTTTLGNLIDFINTKDGISASIENGVFSISDGYIKNSILESSMGLEKSNKTSYVLGSVNTTTTLQTVTGESKLGDILSAMGTTSSVSGGYTLTFDGSSITVSATSTLNSIINEIYAKGGSASLDNTGRLTVTGGTLAGTVATALGITRQTDIASIYSSGKSFTTSQSVYADRDTRLTSLGVSANSTFVIKNTSDSVIKTVTVSSTTTVGNFLDTLKSSSIDGTISDGVITLQSSVGNYIEGSVATTLGIAKRTTTSIINTSQSSTAVVTHTETVTAGISSTLGQVGGVLTSGTNQILIYNSNATCIATISTLTTTSTIENMFNVLKNYGIKGSISDGKISLNSTNGNYVGGTIMTRLGISSSIVNTETTTIAVPISSSSALITSVAADATYTTKMSDLMTLGSGTFTFGSKSISVGSSDTVADFFTKIGSHGIEGTIENGVITLISSYSSYGGTVATGLGLTKTGNRTIGNALTSQTQVTYTVTRAVQGSDKLSDIIDVASGLTPTGTLTSTGSITGGNIVGIRTANDLKYLAKCTNTSGKTFVLMNDITLTDSTWTGIGNSTAFAGTFNGQGHTIKVNIKNSLFSNVSGTVKDLAVVGTITAGTTLNHDCLVGGITNRLSGSIDKCITSITFSGSASGSAKLYCGGIAGSIISTATEIQNCLVAGLSATGSGNIIVSGLGLIAQEAYSTSTNTPTNSGNAPTSSGNAPTGSGNAPSSKTINMGSAHISNNVIMNCNITGSNKKFYAFGFFAGDVSSVSSISCSSTTNNSWNDNYTATNLSCSLGNNNGQASTDTCMSKYSGNYDSIQIWSNNGKIIGSIGINPDTTVSNLSSYLSDYNINLTTGSGGSFTLTSTTGNYLSGSVVNKLNLVQNNFAYSTVYTSTTNFTLEEDRILSTSSKLSELGCETDGYITYQVSTTDPTRKTIYYSSSNTVGELINKLNDAGVAASLSNGRFTLGANDATEGVVISMATNLKGALGLSLAGDTYKTQTVYNSKYLQGYESPALNEELKLSEIRGASTTLTSTTANITILQGGTKHTITVSSSDTLGDIFEKLDRYGINGYIDSGKVGFICTGDSAILGMSNGLNTLLKVSVGSGSSYTVKTENTYAISDSNKLTYTNASAKVTNDTVLNTIASFANGNGKIAIHKANGTTVTISVNATGTIGDFFNQIAAHGLTGSVDSTGKINILGIGDTYLQSVSGGTNIMTALKLSGVSKQTSTSTSNSSSNVLRHSQTVAAGIDTQLQNLKDSSNAGVTFNAAGNVSLVLSTTSKSGTSSTATLTFSKTSTIYDVIEQLASRGITASIDSRGKFSVSTDTLQDFSISGTLGTYLMGNYTKNYDVASVVNTSNSLSEKKVINMNDSTKLTDLGISNGNIKITQNGTSITVNINTTEIETIGDFRNLLSYYGFTTNLYTQGKLSVSGEGESYLSNVTGGSNILTKLGLTTWTMNQVSQSSEYLVHNTVKTELTTASNKLSELTNSSGTALGITSGQIAVYYNGTRSVFDINANETIDSLANRLSQYGITVNLSSDGKLYFNGSNNSYLSTDGIAAASLSNILEKLGATSWTTSKSSTSKKLEYQEQSNVTVDKNTKLSELKNSSGTSLGITNGAFYVYSNGVRNTATITSNMTVGDFISLMGSYGINAELLSDGSISLNANSNSYLATSSLSGSNSNIVSTLFSNYAFRNTYTSDKLEVTNSVTQSVTRDTKLADINEGSYISGLITVVKDGVNTNLEFSANDTIGTFIDKLALYGFNATVNGNGQLVMNATGDSELKNYTGVGASNVLNILGVNESNWIKTNKYNSDELNVVRKTTTSIAATRETTMSELGVSVGEYYVYNNGVKYTAMISSDETLGSFMDTLKSFGLTTSLVNNASGSILTVVGNGDAYIAKSNSVNNASNVVEKLFGNNLKTSYEYEGLEQTFVINTHHAAATEDTLLSYYNTGSLKAEGDLSVTFNGVDSTIKITADDTFGTLIEKLQTIGVEATLSNGQLMIQSGFDSFTINSAGTTSKLLSTINLVYDDDLGGYMASSDEAISNITTIEERTMSVLNYANEQTKMRQLNISDGSLTVYRGGQRALIQVDSDDTFGTLKTKLSTAFSDLDLTFEDGYLKIFSKTGVNVEIGSTTDTTNFSSITGITNNGNGVVISARELYRVSTDSILTEAGLFRSGNVTTGTFIIGDETFTIENDTTLENIISQINASEKANATAYWDSIKGRLVLQSRSTGAAYINIEAGTSNFTNIMGYTSTAPQGGGSSKSALNVKNQEIGQNAKININGTNYTSASNTVTSDTTRIKGLKIKLNGLTEGSAVTLTVEKDKEVISNALSAVVDSYNELMNNVDEAISINGKLHKETSLKLIRNDLLNFMTSSDAGTTVYRNLSAIGISTSAANSNSLSTSTESIVNLIFDKDKFIEAYEEDAEAVKELLIGGENNEGILMKVAQRLEEVLQPSGGYFESAESSFKQQAEKLERKITSGTKSLERYRTRLEAKFASMDMIIANMQQQYSSFLTS